MTSLADYCGPDTVISDEFMPVAADVSLLVFFLKFGYYF